MVTSDGWWRTEQIDELLFVDLNHLNRNFELRVSLSIIRCIILVLICDVSNRAEKLRWNSRNDTWAALCTIHRESFPATGLPISHNRWVKPLQSIFRNLLPHEPKYVFLTLLRAYNFIKLETMSHPRIIIPTRLKTLTVIVVLCM